MLPLITFGVGGFCFLAIQSEEESEGVRLYHLESESIITRLFVSIT